MSLYTSYGLVSHAKKALALDTKYMWGGLLRPITVQYVNTLTDFYKNSSGTGYTAARKKELLALAGKGFYGVDCVGLIKSYYWSGKTDGGTGSPKYGAAGYPDVNANYMFAKAEKKGAIGTIPETPGVIVYSKTHPHVGIYIGNGRTIESTLGSRGDGVVERDLDGFWEYWFECPYIDYGSLEPAQSKKRTFAYSAVVRSKPSSGAAAIGRYAPGNTVTVISGSETADTATGYTYVRIAGDREAWVVRSALK